MSIYSTSVATISSAPTTGNVVNDVLKALDTGFIYRWDGIAWKKQAASYQPSPTCSGSGAGMLSSTDWNTFNNKAPTASPTFTGTPVAPTPTVGDSSTKIATTAFVQGRTMTYTPSTPTRALNTNFTPNASFGVLCIYTISISCTMSLTAGQTGSVELRSDTSATPTTARCRVTNTNSGALTIGLALTNAQESVLYYLVPPGHNVRLVSSGNGTISITNQTEIVIN